MSHETYEVNTPLESISVLGDEVETKPFLDFERYSETIIRMVRGSEPNFSIGIYGEWGTGKTTLMRSIELGLETEKDILTVWFNAWRYEREQHFALVSLMKTIAYRMDEQPKYREVKKILFRSIVTAAKGIASKHLFSEKYVDELQQNITSDMKVLAKADKNTIYFQGLKQIEDVMSNIIKRSPSSRVVVFVDDLDRCSPKKALEVFESIKVFLGIKGFIYIIGLSHETIAKLITAEYEKSGIKGEAYIKKLIQIPIMVPEWNSLDIGNLIKDVLLNKLDERYSKIINDNIELIAAASESNPREVKRFINNFIVSNEIFSINTEVKPQQLLAIQALKVRWPTFYREITTSEDNEFRKAVEEIAEMKYRERINKLREMSVRKDDEKNVNRELEKRLLDIEPNLWSFLGNSKEIIFQIKNWEIYRRAAESTKVNIMEPEPSPPYDYRLDIQLSKQLRELIEAENVLEFNRIKSQYGSRRLTLTGIYILGKNLSGIDLSNADLTRADIRNTNLSQANLSRAILFNANLLETNFSGADLSGADLTGTNLADSILDGTILKGTDFTSAEYFPIDLSEASERGATWGYIPPSRYK
jgi:hypothetical protein